MCLDGPGKVVCYVYALTPLHVLLRQGVAAPNHVESCQKPKIPVNTVHYALFIYHKIWPHHNAFQGVIQNQ